MGLMLFPQLNQIQKYLFSLLLLTSAAVCQNSLSRAAGASFEPKLQPRRVLRGMVVDHSGASVAHIAVQLRPASSRSDSSMSEDAHDTNTGTIALQTDNEGQFASALPAGSYTVCVVRFPKSCQQVHTESEQDPEYLRLQIDPADDRVSPELLDNRLRTIAGPGALDCGRLPLRSKSKGPATCARDAVKTRKPFFVRFDDFGVDSVVASAMAGDARGNVFFIDFDSMGIDSDWHPSGATMPDGFHTKVIPCSQPVRVRVTRSQELTCFADGRWMGM